MQFDTIILGAGAAGLMCAGHLTGHVLIVDHAKAAGEKIRISGGGRCNFTNIYAGPENFTSANPHFCKSALKRYTQWDFIDMVAHHGIAYHEKTLGQLFCDNSARDIIAMLLHEARHAKLRLNCKVTSVAKTASGYQVCLDQNGALTATCRNLVVATGGKSIPKMGATGLAYDIARQFAVPVTDTRAGLVPLTFSDQRFKPLAGVALPSRATANNVAFDEATLFTHRGLSGPAILQVSSYWREGQPVTLNLCPATDPYEIFRARRQSYGRRHLVTELGTLIPARLADYLGSKWDLCGNLADQSDAALRDLSDRLQNWEVLPNGSEGYRTAEVTLGGIDTDALSSTTMRVKTQAGLYFIGECVDVTGWLGGYNFQWAWSSGWAAAQAINGNS